MLHLTSPTRLPGVEGQLSLSYKASAGATGARHRTIEYGQGLPQLQLFVLRDPLTGPTLRVRQPYCFTLRRCSVSWPAWGRRHERASRTHATGGGGAPPHRPWVRASVVTAADRRSPGPWFKSRLCQGKSTPRGFEPLRAEPNGFLVHHRNHSVTVSSKSSRCNTGNTASIVIDRQLIAWLWEAQHWTRPRHA
jgi:hypothetical protein